MGVGSVEDSGVAQAARLGVARVLDRLLRRRPVLAATLVGCVLYLLGASSPTTGLWSHSQRFRGDVDVYQSYAQQIRDGEVPFRDFAIEYPPASLAAFVPPLLVVEAIHSAGIAGATYTDLFKAEMLICGFLVVFIVASAANRLWRDPRRALAAALVVGVSPLALGPIALSWYDTWPTLLTIAAVALCVRRRFTAAFALLGVAIAAKLFALVLLPLFVVQALRTIGWKRILTPLLAFLGATGICFGSAAVISLKGARYPFTYLIDRPVEIESTAGSIVGLFHVLGWWSVDTHVSYGSVNFEGSRAANLGLAIAVVGAATLLALWWRSTVVSPSPEALVAGCTAAIAVALACSKVFSPQYMVWLVPFVAVTLRRSALLTLAVAVVLTRLWFPEHWKHFNNIPPMFALAAPRNLAVCLLAVLTVVATGSRTVRLPARAGRLGAGRGSGRTAR